MNKFILYVYSVFILCKCREVILLKRLIYDEMFEILIFELFICFVKINCGELFYNNFIVNLLFIIVKDVIFYGFIFW